MAHINLTQTNLITLAQLPFTLLERRVLFIIIDSISPYLRHKIDLEKKGVEESYEIGVFDMNKITYKASEICSPNHYNELEEVLKSLENRNIRITLGKNNTLSTRLILKYKFSRTNGLLELGIDQELYSILMNTSKGYTMLQVKTALTLSSIYAVKMYEYISMLEEKVFFNMPLEKLRLITNTTDKYFQISEIKKNVLERSKRILNDHPDSTLSFTYTDIKDNRKITGFNIQVVKKDNHPSVIDKSLKNDEYQAKGIPLSIVKIFEKIDIKIYASTIEAYMVFANKVEFNEELIIKHLKHWFGEAKTKKEKSVQSYIIGCLRKSNAIKFTQPTPNKEKKIIDKQLINILKKHNIPLSSDVFKTLYQFNKNDDIKTFHHLDGWETTAKMFDEKDVKSFIIDQIKAFINN